ncbi:piggyBac transposable element-derived protein 3-like [Metopolophium dirhodum]|uniref:piggyBac transposable element-derived protein 3-like n=1 Tax=Metopolophium dirhodum TaxID=44670 RepID=UPI00298F6034|nr:piggyBac transposable element-derived protein 3-like [Metopolophium dirhodum]
MNKKLVDKEIIHLLEIPSGSEDGFETESDVENEKVDLWNEYGDLLDETNIEKFEKLLSEQFNVDTILDDKVELPIFEHVYDEPQTSIETNTTDLFLPSTSSVQQTTRKVPKLSKNKCYRSKRNNPVPPIIQNHIPIEIKEITWSKDNFPPVDTTFIGKSTLPEDIMELETPYQIFKYLFTVDLMQHICDETYKYGLQNSLSNPLKMSTNDLQKYIGVLVLMSIVNISNVRKYWSPYLGNDVIKDTMNLNTFEKIRKEHLAVDEQMCSTKARSSVKVYMPNKPHKWGYKLFVLSGASGFAYNFELFTGQENNSELRNKNEPDLGSSANVVVRLGRVIPKHQNYKLFFDNYYTTLPLLVYLKIENILSLGTVRRNRLKNVVLLDDSTMLKKPRGTYDHCVTNIRNTDIVAITWNDTKNVNLLSTFAAIEPVTKVSRYYRKMNKRVEVDCPHIIKVYNTHMGGVDLLDGLLGRHKIKMRSCKWYMRLFYHLLDVTIVNSWLLHKRIQNQKLDNNNVLPLMEFREQLAITLCKLGENNTPKRGRPSTDIEIGIIKKGKLGCYGSSWRSVHK